jgi:cytoskeletal protein CcmA (bactofilin family)
MIQRGDRMFSKGKAESLAGEQAVGYDTVVGAGSKVDGDLAVRGSARILGEVEGELQVTGDLDVELGACVRGNIRAERARVAGRIEGDVHVRDSLELRTGAHLRGDVYAKSFRIQDGAIFQGQCHMGRDLDGSAAKREGVPMGNA